MGADLTVEIRGHSRGRSAHHDNGAGCKADHLLRAAAEEETGEPAMTAAADDDQIGPPVSGYRDDFLGGVAKGRLGRYPRCTLRLCLSARIVQHGLGRRENELERRPRHMLQPRVFLDRRIDLRSEMWRRPSTGRARHCICSPDQRRNQPP